MRLQILEERPACTGHLDLVDEAFRRPGGEAAQLLKAICCRGCPVARQCFNEAMANREHGIWGSTSPKARTEARKRAAARHG